MKLHFLTMPTSVNQVCRFAANTMFSLRDPGAQAM